MSRVLAVRDDGNYEGKTVDDLANAGLTARVHPGMEGWLLIDNEGLHGSDADDVDFELSMYRFETIVQEDAHGFLPVAGHPDDNECTFRLDGTDATYCGLSERDHIVVPAATTGSDQ